MDCSNIKMDLIFRVQLNESQRCKQTSCTENIPTLLSASLGNSFQQWRQRLFDLISKWIELICSNFEMDCNTLTKFAFFNSEMCCAPSWSRLMQDRVSRVLFPSTFVLLNIIYWLVFRSPSSQGHIRWFSQCPISQILKGFQIVQISCVKRIPLIPCIVSPRRHLLLNFSPFW